MPGLEPVLGGDDTIRRNFSKVEDLFTTVYGTGSDAGALQTQIEGGLAVWRTIFECAHAGTSWGNLFLGDAGQNGWQLAAAGTSNSFRVFTLTDTEYEIPGYATQVRVVVTFSCNPTAPAINFTAGLATITTVGGGAGTISWSGASFLASSTLTTPSASTFTTVASTPVTLTNATSDQFLLGVTPSGTAAANHRGVLAIHAQMRHIPA